MQTLAIRAFPLYLLHYATNRMIPHTISNYQSPGEPISGCPSGKHIIFVVKKVSHVFGREFAPAVRPCDTCLTAPVPWSRVRQELFCGALLEPSQLGRLQNPCKINQVANHWCNVEAQTSASSFPSNFLVSLIDSNPVQSAIAPNLHQSKKFLFWAEVAWPGPWISVPHTIHTLESAF